MTEFDLNRLVDDALTRSKEADPHVIARRLAPKIPDAHLREVIGALLVERVTLRMRSYRNHVDFTPGDTAHDNHSVRAGGGASRWTRHAPRLRYCVAGEWKFYDDLTADDCDSLAADYASRAAANLALEARFRDLARQLRSARVERVADLAAAGLGEAA